MIKHLLRRIKTLERELKAVQPARGTKIMTSRTTRGVVRKPTQQSNAGGSGNARWA